jgi:hypothetical protein
LYWPHHISSSAERAYQPAVIVALGKEVVVVNAYTSHVSCAWDFHLAYRASSGAVRRRKMTAGKSHFIALKDGTKTEIDTLNPTCSTSGWVCRLALSLMEERATYQKILNPRPT